MNKIIKTVVISTLASTFLLGANIPNIGDIEKQVQAPKIEKEETVLPEIKQKEYKTPMSDSGKKILIKDFKITDNEHIDISKLEKFFVAFKNKELTFNQLQNIASAITKYYRKQGYFVARAYIPTQNINENNGVLEISVIEGTYGELKLNNNSLVRDSILQDMMDDAKNRDNVISTDTFERAMLIINDTPGVVVTSSDVSPGKEVGTSDFEITTQASKRVNGYVVTDNTGSKYTGENRLMSKIDINSPFEIGDKISMFGLVSNGQNLKNGKVAYSAPLASNGFLGEVSYSQTNYSLADSYKSLDAFGTSKTVEGKISYPIIKTKEENLNLSSSILTKKLKDEKNSTDDITQKESKSVKVGLDYDKNHVVFNKSSKSLANVYLTYGKLEFDNPEKQLDDERSVNTNGNYSKVNVDLSNTVNYTSNLYLNTSLKMQYALRNKNLDGSEDFSVGGSSGVKLYPDGELSAENGYLFNTELKYKLPNINNLSNIVGVFYDRGKVFMANNTTDFQSKSLQDIGVGYYSTYKDFFGQMQVAWNANSKEITSEPNRNSRFLFQGGLSF